MHRVALDITAALALPHSCPCCGSAELLVEPDGGGIVLTCADCRRRWHPELGTLVPADREDVHP